MPSRPTNDIDPENIVNQLYDIALNPESLDVFIEAWNAAGLDASAARKTIKNIDDFDAAYLAHLERAETFLARGGGPDEKPDLAAMLAPFEDLAAFIVDKNLLVVACNAGARHAFDLVEGADLNDLEHAPGMKDALNDSLNNVFQGADSKDRMFQLQIAGERGPALFQIRGLTEASQATPQHALVVTTQYHWQSALGETLEDVFRLTAAEQGVVRALVEGLDAKNIAADRGTSEGTVRGQIKSILSKMNARSQSEVIRLVLSLRDVSPIGAMPSSSTAIKSGSDQGGWLDAEVWKPFQTLVMPDGRKMDYHDMGPANGAPILFTHMGYGMVRWHQPMIKLAFQLGLRVIVPVRAGYGHSDNLHPKADVLECTRNDTVALLDHLQIDRLPYACQGNDLIFAADFAGHYPNRVSEIIGICARPWLQGDLHYSSMGKWHRFFLSTAKHAPHLLKFTAKASVAMAKRIGPEAFFRQTNRGSKSDLALLDDPELLKVLIANGELVAGKGTDLSQVYTMELLATESDWSNLLDGAMKTPTWFMCGGEDPASNVATIAAYREAYPWIEIEVIKTAGQLLIYQEYARVIEKFTASAKRA